ncbi:MAG: NAD(P)/FAD-dependent oxidoreductase [Clostridia bacterium]|nr:NAD(P)/FAD-dependent oxidoreductase [Clostridia bacterium]
MKIAIIGAGVSGLSCALELKKHGIIPTIFEKRSSVGDNLSYAGMWPRILFRTIEDPIQYLSHKYNLKLIPLNRLKKIIMASPNKKTVITGKLGHIFKRGQEIYSLENQLALLLNLPIQFDTYIKSIQEVKDSFDYIVVAQGVNIISKELGVWSSTFNSICRVSTVLGSFKTDTSYIWFNTQYAKNGFCYLIPNNEKEATLTQIVNGISHHELDFYWNAFLEREEIRFSILEMRDMEHSTGFVNPMQVGNIYFVGNAGGLTDDLIGFGAFNAVESGIIAARSIVRQSNYHELMQPIVDDIERLNELRKVINTYANQDYDKLIGFLKTPLVKQLLYQNPLFRAKQLSPFAKWLNKKN